MKYADVDIPLPLFRGAPPPPNRKNEPEPEFIPISQQAPPPPPPEEPAPVTPTAAAPPPVSAPPLASPMGGVPGGAPPMGPYSTTEIERENYKMMFYQQDMDRDGFITGGDGVQFFRMSGLADAILGQIWNLADIDQDGRLDIAEFIVAMHLICCATQRGLPVPPTLPPELIPPSKAKLANPVAQSLNKTIDDFATGLVRSRSASRADASITSPAVVQPAGVGMGGMGGGLAPPPPPPPPPPVVAAAAAIPAMPSNTMVGASGNLGVDIAQQALATQTQAAMALGNIAEGLQGNKSKYDQQLQLIEKRLSEQQRTIAQYVERIQSLQLELYDMRETYRKKCDEVIQNEHIIAECAILLSGLSQERQQTNLEEEKVKILKDRTEFTKTMLNYGIDDKGLIPPNPLEYASLDSIPRPPPAGTPVVPSMMGGGAPRAAPVSHAPPPPPPGRAAPPPPPPGGSVPAPPEFAPFPGSEPAADAGGFAPFPGSGSPVQEPGFAAFPGSEPAAPDAGGFAAFPTDDADAGGGFAAFPTDDAAGGGFEAFPSEATSSPPVKAAAPPPPPPPPGRAPPPPPPKSPPKSPNKAEADAGFGAFPSDDGAAGGDSGFGAFPTDDADAGGDGGFGAFPTDDAAGGADAGFGDGGFGAFPSDDAGAGGDGGFGAFPADGGDDGGFGAFPS